jgi:Zn-dependent protease with chaperone function/type II secretory pathway pseudopilin PulG
MSLSQLVSELLAAGRTDEEITAELARKGVSHATAARFLERGKTGSVSTPPAAAAGESPRLAGTSGTFDPQLRHPNEGTLFVVGVVFSALVWLALVLSIVGVFYGVIGVIFTLMAHALFLANIKGNGVRVSARQFPDLDARCQRAAHALGLRSGPDVYLIQAGGTLNAFATKLFSRKFMIIYSDLVDECEDPRQLDFVIGHEMAHLAAGHLTWNAFLWPFMAMPWLGAAYLRAREYTSDRCGYAFVGDVESSMRGLVVLAAGGKHAARADLRAFMEQRLETGQFWSATLELVSSHPYLCKRVAALQELSQPGSAAPVGRNPLAYPLAPILGSMATVPGGGGVGGLLAMVAIVGIIAAIAIPSLLRARVSANEAAAIADIRQVISAQATYSTFNVQFFDSDPSCLATPSRCIPGYTGPAFLDPPLATGTKAGYIREMYPGGTFPARRAPAGASPSSTNGFVIVARPAVVGQTGLRTFCGDSTGTICATTGVSGRELVEVLDQEPWVRCSSSCSQMR